MNFNPFPILEKLNIQPKKKWGQNFLKSEALLKKMLSLAEINEKDVILEIGAGLGFLTRALAEKAQRVYAVEIEPKFCEFLKNELGSFNNIQIINEDILKMNIPRCTKVVSNIPFSITGPILEKVFFGHNLHQGIITIERRLAERIFFQGGYKDFSRITVSVNSFMNPITHFKFARSVFAPTPKIDVSLIKLVPKKKIHPFLKSKETREFYLKFIGGILPYKNKNISNAIRLFYKKEYSVDISTRDLIKVLQNHNFQNKKVSNLNLDEFPNLCEILYDIKFVS